MSNVSFKKKTAEEINANKLLDISLSQPTYEKIAIYSPQSIFWEEVGRISKGFNIVSKQKAEHWLTFDGIRVATPEEVAKEYGL